MYIYRAEIPCCIVPAVSLLTCFETRAGVVDDSSYPMSNDETLLRRFLEIAGGPPAFTPMNRPIYGVEALEIASASLTVTRRYFAICGRERERERNRSKKINGGKKT